MEKARPLITVFTPSFNRRPYLRLLYDSLKRQIYRRFEWVIVDDGSTDGTNEEVAAFVAENQIPVRYYFQTNAGKHVAINRGVELAKGELFFIVDSDDVLAPHALGSVVRHWTDVLALPNAERFAGVCGLRIHPDGAVIGGNVDYGVLDVSAIEYRFKLGYQGDRAEVVRTDIMRRYPYPSFTGERFCTEALVWNRIAKKYLMRYFNYGIYICEYLPGGLSDRSMIERQQSPRSATTYYAELAGLPGLSVTQRIKAAINFWRFAHYDKERGLEAKWKQLNSMWSLIAWPTAFLILLRDGSSKSTKGK